LGEKGAACPGGKGGGIYLFEMGQRKGASTTNTFSPSLKGGGPSKERRKEEERRLLIALIDSWGGGPILRDLISLSEEEGKG